MALSTAVNDGQASALFSASNNPQRTSEEASGFSGLRSRTCLPFLRIVTLVTNGYAGQAPRDSATGNSRTLSSKFDWPPQSHIAAT